MTKFCQQCGAQVNDAARFCNKCGAQLQPAQTTSPNAAPYTAPTANYQTPPNYQQQYQQPGYGQPPSNVPFQPPFQPAGAAGANDLRPSVAGMLSYPLFFITGLLFLVLTPYNRDRFVRFHAFQSIFMFVAYLALAIALGIVGSIMPWPIRAMLSGVPKLLLLAGTVWMMYQAYKGERFKLPVIGDLAESQADKV
jgi:uncharacterized membrane protein